jgi:very-short-patch-repair endonuclease
VEERLWRKLRGRQFAGFKFRRQYLIQGYVADFCCPERELVVELDGGQHIDQSDYDAKRTNQIEIVGFRVMRFWNSEVIENLEGVLETIYAELNEPSP